MKFLNSLQSLGVDNINPDTFKYEELKLIANENGIQITEITNALGVSKDNPRKAASRNKGVIDSKYYYVLVGLIAMKKQSKMTIKPLD